MMNVDMIVPKTAYKAMDQKFAKNARFSRLYPASNMIGGRRRKKNSSTVGQWDVYVCVCVCVCVSVCVYVYVC
jgi:hypothetical protein